MSVTSANANGTTMNVPRIVMYAVLVIGSYFFTTFVPSTVYIAQKTAHTTPNRPPMIISRLDTKANEPSVMTKKHPTAETARPAFSPLVTFSLYFQAERANIATGQTSMTMIADIEAPANLIP